MLKQKLVQKPFILLLSLTGTLLVISILASVLNPAAHHFFSIVALFFPLLFIINGLFLIFFIIKKSKLAYISLILLLSGLYQVSLIYTISNTNDTVAIEASIKLITYNTGNVDTLNIFQKRKQLFENLFFDNSNIICLQEFTPNEETDIVILEGFEHKLNVDYYGIVGGDSSGLSIYTNYEIIKYGWLKQDHEDTYALWSDMIISEDTMRLINVQLQSIRLEDDELESMTEASKIFNLPYKIISIFSKLKRGFVWREEQVRKLENLISNSNHPVVLCGDFNDPPSSSTYRQLAKLLNDSFLIKGNGFGFTYAGRLPLLRIDYVMVSEDVIVLDYQMFDKTFSDHYPVKIEVEF